MAALLAWGAGNCSAHLIGTANPSGVNAPAFDHASFSAQALQTPIPRPAFTLNSIPGGDDPFYMFDPRLFTTDDLSVALPTGAPARPTTEYYLKQGQIERLNSAQTPLDSLFWMNDEGSGLATNTFNGIGNSAAAGGGNFMPMAHTGTLWGIAGLAVAGIGGVLQRRLQRKPAAVGP